ncbi:MAG: ABC transporter [Flavobacteriales bacterium]|nr:ABC transporter [Flavobacteriales bacterium]MAC95152.1 ABC transporter [Flavobacteriales bacterium]|tara:strand:+ start:4071 stop:5939 length:1869 start_codon:yes stop_codon:yes gene_type:complete
MNYLSVENLGKRYGERVLFSEVSFGLEQGQKMALVAKNGEGKTTLLELLNGDIKPDEGDVTWRNGISIAYLRQDQKFDESLTLKQLLYQNSNEMTAAIQAYQDALKNTDDQDAMQSALNRMDATKAWDFEAKVEKLLSIFEMNQIDFDQNVGTLSGGQNKRIALVKLIIDEPDVLILDEPTNHLDIPMIEWLEDYLSQENMTLFMVTHDRYFLNNTCNQILELDAGSAFKYSGTYEYYLEKKAEREDAKLSEVEKAKNLYRKEVEWMRRMPKARGTKAKSRIDQFYDTEKKAKQKTKKEEVQLSVKSERLGGKILELHHLRKSYGDLKIVDDFSYTFKKNEKIGIAGKNGVGKTTFLNLLLGKEQSDGGKVVHGETVKFGYYTQKGIQLKDDKRIIEVVKEIAEVIPLEKGRKLTASQMLERFLFPPKQQYNYVSKLSGGERKRLYLLTVLMSNPNFLILDEPTNDLDIKTISILEQFLLDFQGCLLIVSHDRAFMDHLADHIFHFEGEGKIKDFPGTYSQLIEKNKKDQLQQTKAPKVEVKNLPERKEEKPKKLGYSERREFNKLEKEIEKLEAEKETLTAQLSSSELSSEELMEKSNELGKLIEVIDDKTSRWMELAELA